MYRWPCKDYLKGTCNNSFCWKVAPSRMLVLQDQEWLPFWGKVCSYAHRQVDEQPSRRSKKNDDKSAVAMLKKNDLHESVRQLVVNRDKSHGRSGRPDKNRDHELKRGPAGRRSSNARQLGCVFQDMKPPKVYSLEELRHAETNPTCETHKGHCRSRWNSRPKLPSLGYLPRWTSSAQSQRSEIWGSFTRRDRARCPRSQRGSWPKVYEISRSKKEDQFVSPLEKVLACIIS